jgi:gliding motility-associated lipoprotein GldH
MMPINKKWTNNTYLAGLLAGILLLGSCAQLEVYEKNTPIPNQEWKSSFTTVGSFTISDTLAAYSISLVLRHTDAYKYNNIWLNIGLQPPGDSMSVQKVDLKLASDASGWEGTGMNDIWEVRKLLNGEPRRFKKAGTYRFTIGQIMRDEPLQHVLSAGLRVEKYKP